MNTSLLQLSTLVLAIFVGVCLFIISRYIKIPAIVLLLLGGILLGPEFLGFINPDSLGKGLPLVISLSVAIILFEGGLTLHPKGLKETPRVIRRLLTSGVLITWFGTAALIYLLLNFPLNISLLAASLVIVTGPTVITPLLKRIQIKEKLFHILHWEGVLIDPIGVFIAILCFEWLSIEGNLFMHAGQLSMRLLVGIVIGYGGGKIISVLLQKEIIPEKQSNIFVVAGALFLYFLSEYITHEAGILSVVIAGLVVGWTNPPRLKHIRQFKSEITELAIAVVFLLLAANLKLNNFLELGWNVGLVLAGILFLIRPLNIFLCSIRTPLSFKEKLFLSWIAPRGVVAGSMASLFGVTLVSTGHSGGAFLETFTFSVIAITIILQGGTAGMFARLLNLKEQEKKDWLIIGAHLFSRKIADFITTTTEGSCIFLDTNTDAIQDTQQLGYKAFQGNALSTDLLPEELSSGIGFVLALTDNRDLNQLICERWSEVIDKNNLYRWSQQSSEFEQQIAGMGHPVWSGIGKPSQMSYDIENKEIVFHDYDSNKDQPQSPDQIFLMHTHKGKIFFNRTAALGESAHTLIMERMPHHLAGFLRPQHILFIHAGTYHEALSLALKKAGELYPELPFEQIITQLLEREKEFPTTLAHGVAAPHLHYPGLNRALCFIVHIADKTDLYTYDGESVRLLFLVLSPESEPELHLRLLAEIAKIASNEDIIYKLLKTQSAAELIGLIKN